MFEKEQLEALHEELKTRWQGAPDYELLVRHAHLGIALHDAGRPLASEIDPRVVKLIESHKPSR